MNKKSAFFSIASVFIVLIFIMWVKINLESKLERSKIETTSIRVEILNNIVKDINNRYFERVLYISTKNAFKGLSEYYKDQNFNFEKPTPLKDIASGQIPIYDIRNLTTELIKNGTYYKVIRVDSFGVPTKIEKKELSPNYIDNQFTINGLIEELRYKFTNIGIQIEKLDITNINIYQKDPWHITISADIEYYFTDSNKIASWRGDLSKEVNITIFGFYGYDFQDWSYLPLMTEGYISNMGLITNSWSTDSVHPDADNDNPNKLWCGNSNVRTEGTTHEYYKEECFSEFSYLDKLSGYYSINDIDNYYWKMQNSKGITLGLCSTGYCERNYGCNYDIPDSKGRFDDTYCNI